MGSAHILPINLPLSIQRWRELARRKYQANCTGEWIRRSERESDGERQIEEYIGRLCARVQRWPLHHI